MFKSQDELRAKIAEYTERLEAKFNGKSGTYNLKENSSMKLLDSQDQFLHKSTTSTVISSGSSSSGSSGGSSSHGSSGSF